MYGIMNQNKVQKTKCFVSLDGILVLLADFLVVDVSDVVCYWYYCCYSSLLVCYFFIMAAAAAAAAAAAGKCAQVF